MATDRDWMYRMDTLEFYEGIDDFATQAQRFARSRGLTDGTIQCPCTKCKNRKWKGPEDVKYDLYRYGFIPNYYTWIVHGEKRSLRPDPPVHERVVCRVMPMYTGGSVSIPQHRWLLRKELKREPTAMELFMRTYISKNDKCVVYAAKKTYEQYHENYDANDSLDAESGNVSKKYRKGVDHAVSKKDIEAAHVHSKNDIEVDHVGSVNEIEGEHVGSKNEVSVDHSDLKNEERADHVGSKNDIEVDYVGSINEIHVEHVGSIKEIEVDHLGSKNDVSVDHSDLKNEVKADHVGSKNDIEIEVDHVSIMNEVEVDHVGSRNKIEVNHVGSKNEVSVDHGDIENEVRADHVGSKNETEGDDVGSKDGDKKLCIRTSNNVELVHIREMMERQQVEQKLLRNENEYLRATQLTQTQKLDQVMQSQKSLEENVRCIVAQEMEKATKKLLDALQNLPRGL